LNFEKKKRKTLGPDPIHPADPSDPTGLGWVTAKPPKIDPS
jgi:hypothetical protein